MSTRFMNVHQECSHMTSPDDEFSADDETTSILEVLLLHHWSMLVWILPITQSGCSSGRWCSCWHISSPWYLQVPITASRHGPRGVQLDITTKINKYGFSENAASRKLPSIKHTKKITTTTPASDTSEIFQAESEDSFSAKINR